MVINHSTAHIPGDIVPSADWNAGHIIDGNAKEVLFRDAAGNIDTASNLVYDPATGYVGIGTNSPNKLMHITKSFETGDVTLKVQNSFGSADSNAELLLSTSGLLTNNTVGASIYADRTDSIVAGSTDLMFKSSLGAELNINMIIKSTGNVGIGTETPGVSAKLEIASTTGALLLSRMTTVQRDALTAVNGMLIYNSTDNKFQGYENGAWANLI